MHSLSQFLGTPLGLVVLFVALIIVLALRPWLLDEVKGVDFRLNVLRIRPKLPGLLRDLVVLVSYKLTLPVAFFVTLGILLSVVFNAIRYAHSL